MNEVQKTAAHLKSACQAYDKAQADMAIAWAAKKAGTIANKELFAAAYYRDACMRERYRIAHSMVEAEGAPELRDAVVWRAQAEEAYEHAAEQLRLAKQAEDGEYAKIEGRIASLIQSISAV